MGWPPGNLCFELLDAQFSGDEHNCAYLPRHVMHNLGMPPCGRGAGAVRRPLTNIRPAQLSRMAAT